MIAEKNLIKKLTVEVNTNSMAIALQLKDDLDLFLKEKIYPILDRLFSEKYSKNDLQRFENIELTIDLNREEKLEDITPKIIHQIQKEISKKETSKTAIETRRNSQINTQHRALEAFLFFLKNGQYPWWFDERNLFTPNTINELDRVDAKSIINSSIHLNRLLYQFDIQIIIALYFKIVAIDKTILKQLGIIPSLLKNERFKIDFFHLIFKRKQVYHPEEFLDSFTKLLKPIFTKNTSKKRSKSLHKKEFKKLLELLLFCNKILGIPIQLKALKNSTKNDPISLNNSLNNAIKLYEELAPKLVAKKGLFCIEKESFMDPFSESITLPKSEEKTLQIGPDFDPKEDAILEQGIIVKNAGLILIHPFIKHFFEKLDFLLDGKIKPEKIDAAVHLLHYLACKEEQPQEHLLLFEKYLCNIPLQQPIKRFIKLTAFQKEACEELLLAMMTHWEGLKTKNTDVLRNEFLLREGKLKTTNERDSLYIQRKTQDILMDSLPWNFHLVKIPWKKKILFVEW
ncbi:MAG: contractile injection system tape measure protein [Flavobacteriaceae bacterium]